MKHPRFLKKYVFTMSLLVLTIGRCATAAPPKLGLSLPDILSLKERLNAFDEKLPDPAKLGISKVIAYEENKHFVYMMGQTPSALRRIFYIKPSTLIVSDVLKKTSDQPGSWVLRLDSKPKVEGRRITIGEGKTAGFCETILPKEVDLKPADSTVAVAAKQNHSRIFVHMLYTGGDDKTPAPVAKLIGAGHVPQLKIALGDTSYQLVLPTEQCVPGTIAVLKPGGKDGFARRLLPSGILPHGKNGVGMLQRWDNAYRNGRRPAWDTGRVAFELRKVVENGTIKPCRVVVLGCGTGTNAEYLAGKGFEVTAIDISPTALVRAKEKSDITGSGVRWMFADVLAPPDMEPFDFIFDRGCYHGIRRHNAAGFVKTSRRLSRAGTKFLLLAGNANEKKHWGPPRIKESEIREDFSPSFKFLSMKQSWFDLGRKGPGKTGPMAWAVLLERKKG